MYVDQNDFIIDVICMADTRKLEPFRALSLIYDYSTPRKCRGSYSKRLGELSLVDSDSTRREEHAYIGHSSG